MAGPGEGGPPPASCGVPDPDPGLATSKPTVKDPAALSEDAWERINEAMQCGVMRLPSGREVSLGPKEIVDLTKWLATLKAKRPRAVSKVEDFDVRRTKQ